MKMNKKINNKLSINVLVFLFSFIVFGLFVYLFKATTLFAVTDELTYKLLADLPGIGDSPTYSEYLKNSIKLIIGLITALSVLVMVYAGVEHVAGAAKESSRSAAKERMWGALLGLIIALISYIVLNTINPDLLSLNLTVSDIPEAAPSGSSFGFNCLTSCPCPDPCASMSSASCPNPDAALCAGLCGASCY